MNTLKYQTLEEEIKSIIDLDLPLITNLANLSALLFTLGDLNWCGFYLYDEMKESLYLGPFQGPPACTVIPLNKGVCGKATYLKETIIVADVHQFVGHIACSSNTNSEIVVPIIKDERIVGVIDLDSPLFNRFNKEDQVFLERVAKIISPLF